MNPQLIDTHTHTQFAAFEIDNDIVINRALNSGIWLVNVGTQKDTSQNAVKIANEYPRGVYATVGIHPIHTTHSEQSFHDSQELGGSGKFNTKGEQFDPDFYIGLAKSEKVVAIGECGLDYYRAESGGKEKQIAVFEKHIQLAKEVGKPLMIHCRQAFDKIIEVLKNQKTNLSQKNPGIIHFFSGTKEHAKELLELGFSFSFGGVITFARDYDGVVNYIPIEKIVLETDAPYVAPTPYRGKRNEPLYVEEVAKKLAEIKGIPFDEIASKTTENAKSIFGLK